MDRSTIDILEALTNDEMIELGIVVATPDALAALLKQRPEVIELRRAVDRGSLTSAHIRTFVAALLCSFKMGKKFAGDISLSALAMALETHPSSFAEDYLRELSRLRIQEIPMSPRVAAIALRHRARILSGTTVARFTLSHVEPRHGARVQLDKAYRVTSEHSHVFHKVAA